MSSTEDLPTAAGTYDADEADRVEQALPVRPEAEDPEDTASWETSEAGVIEADAADVAEQRRPVPNDPNDDEVG
jgi:hypothetical protein